MTVDLTGIGPEGLRNWKKWCEQTIADWNAKGDLTPEEEQEKQEAQSDLDQITAVLAPMQQTA